METKRFKPYDKVIYRDDEGIWQIDFYSYRDEESGLNHVMTFGNSNSYGDNDILPYEGNEELVGTNDEPDEEVRLEEGEWVAYYDEYDREFKHWKIGAFKDIVVDSEGGGYFQIHVYPKSEHTNFVNHKIIHFSDFNPEDMEETKKHILCVKKGRIVKYKEP